MHRAIIRKISPGIDRPRVIARKLYPVHQRGKSVSDSFRSLFDAQNERFLRNGPQDPSERKERLRMLKKELLRRQTNVREALHADFRKPGHEVEATELAPVIVEINTALRNLERWMKPRRLSSPRFMLGTHTEERVEPRGVSCIISPWNYVVNLTLGPLVSAVAAGCPVMLKPSEHTPHTSVLLDSIVASVFPREEAVVVLGDASAAERLLELPFRHVHFTGSPRVGRLVMRAAATYPASVTLELGGKSPAYVDPSADIDEAADRIAFGKWTNAGQTCIAADYVLVDEAVRTQLTTELETSVGRMFGREPAERSSSPDYARLVHEEHFRRMSTMLDEAVDAGAEIAFGGRRDAGERYFEPTVVLDPPADSAIMREEIFGPVLPVVTVSGPDEAVEKILNLDPPLSMYVFGDDVELARSFSRRIRTGAVCMNETLLHFVHPEAGFGGFGPSGVGRAHGRDGFLSFSNRQTILERRWGGNLLKRLYPPYSDDTDTWVNRFIRLS